MTCRPRHKSLFGEIYTYCLTEGSVITCSLRTDSKRAITRTRNEMSVKFSFRCHSEINLSYGRDGKRILFKMPLSLDYLWRFGVGKGIWKSGVPLQPWGFWVQDPCFCGISNWETQSPETVLEPGHLAFICNLLVLAQDVTQGLGFSICKLRRLGPIVISNMVSSGEPLLCLGQG